MEVSCVISCSNKAVAHTRSWLHGFIESTLESCQGWKFHSFSVRPMQVPHCCSSGTDFPHVLRMS